MTSERRLLAAWAALTGWGVVGVAGVVAPDDAALAAAQGPLLILFVALHASRTYGWSGLAMLALVGIVIPLCCENLSIATGVPFGHFTHTDAFGFKIGAVPVAVALGYVLMGYPAWMLARLLDGDPAARPGILTPLVATFIVTGFDLTVDPIGATVQGSWHYRTPSGINGVPMTNFLGWIVTATMIFLAWRRLLAGRDRAPARAATGFWAQPVVFWAAMAATYALQWTFAPGGAVSASGRTWLIADVYETVAINAMLVMGFVVLLGASRLYGAGRSPPA